MSIRKAISSGSSLKTQTEVMTKKQMKFFCSGYLYWATEDTTINKRLLKKEREIIPALFLCFIISNFNKSSNKIAL
jgi:hypothetical protein